MIKFGISRDTFAIIPLFGITKADADQGAYYPRIRQALWVVVGWGPFHFSLRIWRFKK